MDAPSRSVDRYRLVSRLGRGGQSDVWVAFDPTLGRTVALKVLRTSATESVRESFEREASIAKALVSRHTIRVLDFGTAEDGTHYLAMEHLVGCDLAELVAKFGPLPPARTIHFAVQVCRSLEEAHAAGLVHRDVKPSNLFAAKVDGEHDVVKLLDFGIARALREAHGTRVGGTPAYLAPECCAGAPASPASDLYALGASLYHLLTGAPPFAGDVPDVIEKHREDDAERPSVRLGAELPVDLEAVVLRSLAKRPDERHASAKDLRVALEGCAHAGAWTTADAARFWDEEHRAAHARWTDDTRT